MMAVGQIAMHNLPSCAALVRGTDEEEEKGREREGRIGIKEPHLCHVHRRANGTRKGEERDASHSHTAPPIASEEDYSPLHP